jgi:glycosyltransferase involved in cell wall biosynthesis
LKRLFKKIDEWFVRNALPIVCKNIIVISDLMEKKYSACKNLIKLPPLVDTTDDCWTQPIKESENFEFCFSGRLDGGKESVDKLIKAFSSIKNDNIRLNIMGITKQEFNGFYNMEVDDNRISFMGEVSHNESIKQVLSSDCYVFVRQSCRRNNAGFPTKFAESYTAGTRIITTNTSDIASYYKENDLGTLLESVSVDSMKSAMLFEIENGKRKNKGQLRKGFDIAEYGKRVEAFLQK